MGIEVIHGKKYFSATQSSPTAIARQAAVTGKRIFVTDIAGSSDKSTAVLQVKQGASTVLWAIQLECATSTPYVYTHSFISPIIGATSTPVWVEVDGTVIAKANISGFIA